MASSFDQYFTAYRTTALSQQGARILLCGWAAASGHSAIWEVSSSKYCCSSCQLADKTHHSEIEDDSAALIEY